MADLLSKYGGRNFQSLPTPCFIIEEDKFNENCKTMLNNVYELAISSGKDIRFRAHIKTHKTAQGTLKQLGHNLPGSKMTSNAVLISTIKEAHGLLEYQESIGKEYVEDICYSIPACVAPMLQQLSLLTRRVENVRIFVDNLEHLNNLVGYGRPASHRKWSVFVKIDMGTHRAGLAPQSTEFLEILQKLQSTEVLDVVELYGFYAHAGHSYSSSSMADARIYLFDEIKAVNDAALLLGQHWPSFDLSKLVLSVGATPTSTSLRFTGDPDLAGFIKSKLVGTLEIHCGNYCVYDLQQLSTGCIKDHQISGFVLATIFSSYPTRNEMLADTGVMALTREASKFPGHGLCIKLEEVLYNEPFSCRWYVNRVSQEHGILAPFQDANANVEDVKIGSKTAILPQHACIVMGQFPYYFIINKQGIVTDLWTPYQKW